MTTRHLFAITLAVALLAGCSTTRQERSAQAAASMADLRKLLDRGADQSAKLAGSTEKLTLAAPEDIRKAYERFSRDSRELQSIAADGRSLTASMKKRSETYLAKWAKEIGSIDSEELRKMSGDRQAVLQQEYQKITDAMTELSRTYVPFEQNLKDIEKFLGNDLTVAGRNLAKPALNRLAGDLPKVKASTRAAQETLTHLEQILKPR